MAFMWNRSKIQNALGKEFESSGVLESALWLVDTSRGPGGVRVTVSYMGSRMSGSKLSEVQAADRALRAYGVVRGMVDCEVEAAVSLGDGVFCQVSPETHHAPMIFDASARQWRPVMPPLAQPEAPMPCARCGTDTDGRWGRSLEEDLDPPEYAVVRDRYPTLHLCRACAGEAGLQVIQERKKALLEEISALLEQTKSEGQD